MLQLRPVCRHDDAFTCWNTRLLQLWLEQGKVSGLIRARKRHAADAGSAGRRGLGAAQ